MWSSAVLWNGPELESIEQWSSWEQVPGQAGLTIAFILNAEESFDMAMSLEEADAILASNGFVDSEAELELV